MYMTISDIRKEKIILLVAVATTTTIRSNTQHFKFYFSVLIKEKKRERIVCENVVLVTWFAWDDTYFTVSFYF